MTSEDHCCLLEVDMASLLSGEGLWFVSKHSYVGKYQIFLDLAGKGE